MMMTMRRVCWNERNRESTPTNILTDDSDGDSPAPVAEAKSEEKEAEGESKERSIEKQDDVEQTQVAWETLEVARLIYEKHPEKAAELSDTRYALAEIFLETGISLIHVYLPPSSYSLVFFLCLLPPVFLCFILTLYYR